MKLKSMLTTKSYLQYFSFSKLLPLSFLGLICLFIILQKVFPQDNEAVKEKKETALVKIFNACDRGETPLWQTGLDLKFKDQLLADDIRVAEVGSPREIEFGSKDTIDVFRNENFLTEKRTPVGSKPRASAQTITSFVPQSISVILVEGNLSPEKEQIFVKVIQEFPQPPDVLRPTTSRIVFVGARSGEAVYLDIVGEQRVTLNYGDAKEIFISPGEKEINLLYLQDDSSVKRQLAVFKFAAGKYYTGILLPGGEKPDRPLLRFSDSNAEWAGIQEKIKEKTAKEER